MKTQRAWRRSATAGALMIVAGALFGRIPGMTPCAPLGGIDPVIAFEMVRTPADVARMFGVDPCRARFASAQATALWLDALWFIPAYALFLFFAWRAAHGRAIAGLLRAAVTIAIVAAALLDEIEGVLLTRILGALPGPSQAMIDPLYVEVRVKLLLLGLATIAIGVAPIGRPPGWRRIAGGIVAAGGLLALVGLAALPPAIMIDGLVIGWLALLATALVSSFRRASAWADS